MNISEKSAYLKGLLAGMDYDTSSNEGKLFSAIIELLEDISDTLMDIDEENVILNSYIEELDEDLGNLEEIVYGADSDDSCLVCGVEQDEFDYDDDEFDDEFDEDIFDDVEDDDDDVDEIIGFKAVECEHCGEDVYIDSNFSDDSLRCPHCFETIDLKE